MKTVSLVLILSLADTARSNELLQLTNSGRLRTFKNKIHKSIESLVHVKTFDEIPIFGGNEYRRSILEQSKTAKIGASGLNSDEKTGLVSITKGVGCSIAKVVSSTTNSLL